MIIFGLASGFFMREKMVVGNMVVGNME